MNRSLARFPLTFLKLGGSLITEKDCEHALRPEALARLVSEIAEVFLPNPQDRLILGHGAGSFGHVPAKKYGTRRGVHTPEEWQGFIEVWREEIALNRLVMDALAAAGLPALAFPPAACVTASDGAVATWNLAPLQAALETGLLPVIFGDVVFDQVRGGTILSTEDLFEHLAVHFRPQRVLLAGMEPGVWKDFPYCTQMIDEIRPDTLPQIIEGLGGSVSTDVTGGMLAKVIQSIKMVQAVPGLEVRIFSGDVTGAVQHALTGDKLGTLVHNPRS